MISSIAGYEYPCTNLNEYNLDWIIKKLSELEQSNTWVINDVYDPVTRTLNLSVKSLRDMEG